MKIILYSNDINLLSYWQEVLLNEECSSVDELEELYKISNSLIILNYSACLGDARGIIKRLNSQDNKVLVLHRVPAFDTAKELLKAGASGYGNALMKDHFIYAAVNAIRDNMIWLYPEFTSKLIMEVPSTNNGDLDEKLELLTSREKDVVLLLKDAYSYKEIAQKLDITPRTVKAHAQHAYVKLHVKDRLGLALLLK